MDFLNFILSKEFLGSVYTIAKWIFTILSIILLGGVIWLFRQISSLRQKLNIKEAYKEYSKPGVKKETGEIIIKKSEKIKETEVLVSTVKITAENNYSEENGIQNPVLLKWIQINKRVESESEKDWKLSLLEADALLDLALKQRGLPGESFKERLNAISQESVLNLDDVWTAHKTRNEIAHNTDFTLTKKDFEKILKIYKEALENLEVI